MMEILSVIRGLRRRDSNPERLGIVERLSFRKKAIRGPASPLPPRPPTMGGRGSNTGGRSNSLGHSGGLQIEERSKGGTLTKGGRQAQGENCFTTHPQSASHKVSPLFHHCFTTIVCIITNHALQGGCTLLLLFDLSSAIHTWRPWSMSC